MGLKVIDKEARPREPGSDAIEDEGWKASAHKYRNHGISI